jgi:hypothetical protein
MIDRQELLARLKPLVRDIERDLRARFDAPEFAAYRARLAADWQQAFAAARTAEALETWAESQFTQSAVAWVLAAVFVRFCEDNALVESPSIAGENAVGQSAVARQEAFYAERPLAADNDYLREVFAQAGKLPGLDKVFARLDAALQAPVSGDVAKKLVQFFRATDADSGKLVFDFADPEWNTRFLGDLYQDLSEAAKKRYALLQTPDFIESFILDRTLTPALDEFALEEVDVIDPTCGSGHFLLGAFERLAPRWLEARPQNPNVAIQEALNRVAGIDLNPFAVAIARFRLLLAALKLAGVRRLRLATDFKLLVETGDSLLHGFDQRDYVRGHGQLDLGYAQENLAAGEEHLYAHAFAAEDLAATNGILGRKYAVVVGNPPYITVKDKALSALYRERYRSCSGKYALVSPFCERFWALARFQDSRRLCGHVGLIVANSFMKREFGKALVEWFFPQVDLTHVIDTSGAYIPGHGTPTAILLGLNRPPATSVVRAVMGIKGEPSTPADPAKGVVWSAIVGQVDNRDSVSEWVSVSDVSRDTFAKHPWSIGGGGAAELREQLEDATDTKLLDLVYKRKAIIQMGTKAVTREFPEMGFAAITGEDDVYVVTRDYRKRLQERFKAFVEGDQVRDWSIQSDNEVLFPYVENVDFLPQEPQSNNGREHFWRFRTNLKNRLMFGKTPEQSGISWWELRFFVPSRLKTEPILTFAEVATHNHFVLDRGGKVFKQTAPVIKLPPEATEDDHLGLLGLLNSSTACFWLKQVCQKKGAHLAGKRTREERYAHDSTKVGQFPVAAERPLELARRLDKLATAHAQTLPAALLATTLPSKDQLAAARAEAEKLRGQMIAWQEELDWQVYAIYDIWHETLTSAAHPPEIRFGERAFEIHLARQCAAGQTTTTWFERHGATPTTEIPAHWPADYRALVEKRIQAIERSRDLALIERPECKRRWSQTDWDTLQKTALENWLLDRLEGEDLWPRGSDAKPKPQTLRDLLERLGADQTFRDALDLYAGQGNNPHDTLVPLVQQASCPFLDALRYTESGRRKRALWLQTWQAQREEDAIAATTAKELAGQPAEAIEREIARRKKAQVGAIPVPPKYKQEDFTDLASWRLRGALDVAKERFIGFPGLERSHDRESPMLLWAGYDARQRALALGTFIFEMNSSEAPDSPRFAPALAGLDEWLPWVFQWHPEIDPDIGISIGDYLRDMLDNQLAEHRLTLDAIRAWQPPTPPRKARGRRRKNANE